MCEKTENVLSCETVMLLRETNEEGGHLSPRCSPDTQTPLSDAAYELDGHLWLLPRKAKSPTCPRSFYSSGQILEPSSRKAGTRGPIGPLGHTCARAEVGIKAEGEVALSGGERAMGLVQGRKGRKQLEEELKEAAIYIYFWPCGILVP